MTGSWTYAVPPDLLVEVRAAKEPRLLSRCLGGAVPPGRAGLVLDLTSEAVAAEHAPAVSVRGVYKAVPWSARITRPDEGGWSIAFRSLALREYLALHIALLPALRRLLLDQRVAMITGAAFARGDGATVLAGRTARGKTSLLLGALERDALLIGDEYLGLHESSEVTPVVRLLALRRPTLALAPRMLERLNAQRRLSLRLAELVARGTRSFLQPLVHVPPDDLGGHSTGGGRVERLFWLEAGDRVACEPMERAEAVEGLATVQAVHDVAYSDLGAFIDPFGYGERWRYLAARALEDVACYRLTLPARGSVPARALDHVLSAAGGEGATG